MDAGGAQVESVLDPSGFLLAGAYAEALLGVLPDNAAAEELAAELSELVRLLDEVDGFEGLLTATLLSKAQRMAMVDRVFDGRCSETLLGLLGVLARNARLGLLRGVAGRFRRLLDAREGKVEVFVTTASPLDESDRAQVVAALREALQAEPIVRARVDENVLGGLVVRVGDRVFDASLATQLRRLKKAIVSRKLKATTRE